MLDADHDVGVAAVPLNVTVLLPLPTPNVLPLIVIATEALDGGRLVSVGAAVTVNVSTLLGMPPTDDEVARGGVGGHRGDVGGRHVVCTACIESAMAALTSARGNVATSAFVVNGVLIRPVVDRATRGRHALPKTTVVLK